MNDPDEIILDENILNSFSVNNEEHLIFQTNNQLNKIAVHAYKVASKENNKEELKN